MRTSRHFLLIVAVLIPAFSYGQYYNDRALEKSFEQTDFFFRPSFLNPYAIGGFGRSAPGLVDDPLLNLELNPAYLIRATEGNGYGYLDFRSSRLSEESYDYYYPYAEYGRLDAAESADVVPSADLGLRYPGYYIDSRKILEPAFSGAYLFQPFARAMPNLRLGVTYQVLFQDDHYRSVPQDIYRTEVGADYNGTRTPTDIPIIDRYSGADAMREVGHFVTAYAGYALTKNAQLGVRVSRTVFDRNGDFGSQNLWNGYGVHQGDSFWRHFEGRSQDYGHWDLSGGLNVQLSRKVLAGLSGGYLTGNASQVLSRADSSFYSYGNPERDPDANRYFQSGFTDQHWAHDGHTRYAGANLEIKLRKKRTLNLNYRYLRENVDLTSQSALADTAFSSYRYTYDGQTSAHESTYAVDDVRSGGGTRTGNIHQGGASLRWQVDRKTRLHFGAFLQRHIRDTQTEEAVEAGRFTDYFNQYNGTEEAYNQSIDEQKILQWNFQAKTTRVEIPVLLYRSVSKTVDLMFGINRNMTAWRIEDQTLARFDFRTVSENGETRVEDNFGERFTEPVEQRSEVETALLAGLIVSPSAAFDVRVMLAPNYRNTAYGTTMREFQGWISFNLNL